MRAIRSSRHLPCRTRGDAGLLVVDWNLTQVSRRPIRRPHIGATYSRIPATASILYSTFGDAKIRKRGQGSVAVVVTHLPPFRPILHQLKHLRSWDQAKQHLVEVSERDGTGEANVGESCNVLPELPCGLEKAIVRRSESWNQAGRCCQRGKMLVIEAPESQPLGWFRQVRLEKIELSLRYVSPVLQSAQFCFSGRRHTHRLDVVRLPRGINVRTWLYEP